MNSLLLVYAAVLLLTVVTAQVHTQPKPHEEVSKVTIKIPIPKGTEKPHVEVAQVVEVENPMARKMRAVTMPLSKDAITMTKPGDMMPTMKEKKTPMDMMNTPMMPKLRIMRDVTAQMSVTKEPVVNVSKTPSVEIPNKVPLTPPVQVPKVPMVPMVEVPEVPKVPDVQVPKVEVPKVPMVPQVEVPKVPVVPHVHVPKVPTVPTIEVPKVPVVPSVVVPKVPEVPKVSEKPGAMKTEKILVDPTTEEMKRTECNLECTKFEYNPICATNGKCLHEFPNQCVMDAFTCQRPQLNFKATMDDRCEMHWLTRCTEKDLMIE